ncbi:putative ribonuclease H-like domain-containing protein, partial [Tanacetum coccineum]
GKGTIKTSTLDFENVYYVEELQHFNLFSVSQICDQKNRVLFTDTDCLVLTKDFQLPDDSQVVLRIPRDRDLYTFSISDLQPEHNITCLVAKASLDESTRWHRRMAHVNFKTINKLAKEGLVEGLPLKVFTNEHNCVACNKGKQHKASYKPISAVYLDFLLAERLVSAGSYMFLLVVILPAASLVSAGSYMFLLVVILPAASLVSAGSYMFLLVVILPAASLVSAVLYFCWMSVPAGLHVSAVGCLFLLTEYIHAAEIISAVNTSIYTAELVCAGSIMFLLVNLFLLNGDYCLTYYLLVAGSVIQTIQDGLRKSYECLDSAPMFFVNKEWLVQEGTALGKDFIKYVDGFQTEVLIPDVARSPPHTPLLDSAVHRVHAVSFDAAVASVVSVVCKVAAGYISCSFLLAVQEVPADYVSADHVLNSADRYRIC